MKMFYVTVFSLIVIQSLAFAQNSGESSSVTSGFNSSAASVKVSESTLSTLRALPSFPLGKSTIVEGNVAVTEDLKLPLDDSPMIATTPNQSRTSRTPVRRRLKVQLTPGINSYYFHIVEKNKSAESKVNAEAYLRFDIATDDDGQGDIYYLTQKPSTTVAPIFKMIEAKITGTILENIQLKTLVNNNQ